MKVSEHIIMTIIIMTLLYFMSHTLSFSCIYYMYEQLNVCDIKYRGVPVVQRDLIAPSAPCQLSPPTIGAVGPYTTATPVITVGYLQTYISVYGAWNMVDKVRTWHHSTLLQKLDNTDSL